MNCMRNGITNTGRRMYSSIANEANGVLKGRTIITVTTNDFPGKKIEVLGIVQGLTVRIPTIKQGIIGNATALLGGTNKSFTEMCKESRQEAFNIMLEQASELNADAIVAIRFQSCSIGGSGHSDEFFCCGTAVKFKD